MKHALIALLFGSLVGCEASTYEACVKEAASHPTEVGVRIAYMQCKEKFKAANAD